MKRLLALAVMAMLVLLAAQPSDALELSFAAFLKGSNENPANDSLGTGLALVDIDTTAHTLSIFVEFSGLRAPTTDAHIHCCIAPPGNTSVAVPDMGALPGFPLMVTSGVYSHIFDLTSTTTYRPGFLNGLGGGTAAGAEAALLNGIENGLAYVNIHSSFRPAGEIRDFLQAVPEPGTFGLMAVGVAALGIVAVRRRRG
jgi:hypothetical protein